MPTENSQRQSMSTVEKSESSTAGRLRLEQKLGAALQIGQLI